MIEIWKDILEYEGMYQVSNLGRVKSLDRMVNHYKSKNGTCIKRGKILNIYKCRDGYYNIELSKLCKGKNKMIHRLVAETFIDNKKQYPCVNHIDGNKLNNRVDNLEWCTHSENSIHSFKIGLHKNTIIKCREMGKNNCKKVNQYDLSKKYIKTFNSMKEAAQITNSLITGISYCVLGKRKSHNNFIWKYA